MERFLFAVAGYDDLGDWNLRTIVLYGEVEQT